MLELAAYFELEQVFLVAARLLKPRELELATEIRELHRPEGRSFRDKLGGNPLA